MADRRTDCINNLCSKYGMDMSKLKITIENIQKKFCIYGAKKAQATKKFIITGDQTGYDGNMKWIDENYNLASSEWFILKEFNTCIQSLDFIK